MNLNPVKPLSTPTLLVAVLLTLASTSLTAPAAPPPSTSGMTPPELLEIVRSEIMSGDPTTAASTFMVAMAYSFYDARRSSGPESRRTFADLTALALSELPAESLGAFAVAGRNLSSQPQKISQLLTIAGRPVYDLSYLGDDSAPRKDFNPDSAWSEIVSGLSRPQLVPR